MVIKKLKRMDELDNPDGTPINLRPDDEGDVPCIIL
jgi:hypothetical protein